MAEPEGKMPETEAQSADVAVDTIDAEPFDKERAMETIRKQREEVKQVKKIAQELEGYKKAEEARKLAEMSETDRLKAELTRVQSELKATSIRTMQMKVAAEFELPTALAERLKGETLEELQADAKAIKELMPKQKAAPNMGATNPGEQASKDETRSAKKARLLGQAPDIYSGGGINWGEKLPKE